MRYFFSFSILVLAALGLQNCGNPYAGYGDDDYDGRSRGKIPFSNNSINSFRSMVNSFDGLGSADFSNGFSEENLRNQEFYGPLMKDIIDETDPESPLYCQAPNCFVARVVVNMGANNIFSENIIGAASIFITENQYAGQSAPDISTLVLPSDFQPEDYEGSYSLSRNIQNFDWEDDNLAFPPGFNQTATAIPQGFTLQGSEPVSDSCSVLTVGGSAGNLTVHNELVDFDDLDETQRALGVSSCPISITSLDYRNAAGDDSGSIDLKIGVEPLPGYQDQNGQSTRWGISSLGNFPFENATQDSRSALSSEQVFEFRNAQNQRYLLLYHFYYNLFPTRLNRPEELGSYSYLGTFTDPVSGKAHEYYAHHDKVSPKPLDVKRTANLLLVTLGASEVYAADPGSAAENNFIRQKLNSIDAQDSYLLGFDDCGDPKKFQTARDTSLPRFGLSTSRYTNWAPAPTPRNGGLRGPQPNSGDWWRKKGGFGGFVSCNIGLGSCLKPESRNPKWCHVAMEPNGKWTHVDASHRAVVFEVVFGHTSSGSIGSGSSGSGSGSGGTFTGGN